MSHRGAQYGMTISTRSPWEKVMTNQEGMRRLREIMGDDCIDATELVVNNLTGKYQDQYFRWLAARRDYPFLSDAPPSAPWVLSVESSARLCAEWDREFARRT